MRSHVLLESVRSRTVRRIPVAACVLLAFVLIVPKSPVSADAEPRVEKALSAPAVNATGSVPAKTIAIFAKFTLSTGAVISL